MPMIEMRRKLRKGDIMLDFDQVVYPNDSQHSVISIKAPTKASLDKYLSGFDDCVLVDSKLFIYLKRFYDIGIDGTKQEPDLIDFPQDFKLFGLIKDEEAMQKYYHGSDVSYESWDSEDMREYAVDISNRKSTCL